MPTPRPALFKNATGCLQENLITTRNSLPLQIRAASSQHQTVQPVSRRNLHLSAHSAKERQITPSRAIAQELPARPSPDVLAELTAGAWSTSVINTGFPVFLNEFPSFPPPAEPIHAPAKIRKPNFDISYTYWSFSPLNPGAWISDDSIFALQPRYNFPPTSPEAYDNIMASDEDYSAFLDKAAADRQEAPATQSKVSTQSKTVNTQELHPALKNVQQHTYTSDADEPFEPVSLSRASGKTGGVDKGEVAHVAGVKDDKVEELNKKDFDPRGKYEAVWKQVTEASEGAVKAFKVERGGARSEYWILGVSKDGHVVGARATAVES